MPLRLDIKRVLAQRSDRVKCVDVHPTEPWILSNLYNGNIYIWNHNDSTLVKSFEVTDLPVRSAKFVARKQWIVCGADDMFIRVFNYNTMDKVKAFEAHTDYIRSVAVHPTMPYLLSSSDDMLIKLWDWDKNWQCTQVFEGHSHYVMQVVFNPKDTNTFASASLDRTVKVWSIGQPVPNFTLEGHEKGVNCIDYFTGGDKPYLITGADDQLVKVWDYQTKQVVQTLEGHTHNISAVCFHPELPIIMTGSEDGSVKIWHSTTYRLESTLNYGLERVWSIGYLKGSNKVAFGYDEGTIMIKMGREEPVASMDTSGKIVWAKHNEIQTVNVKSLPADFEFVDGERLPLSVKDLGATDMYPQTLEHSPNGRFVVVCGDGEYVIYTALAWRNKSFGPAQECCFSLDSSEYAVRESTSKVKVFKQDKERTSIRPAFSAEGIFGGPLLTIKSTDYICLYDWAECRLLQRIDVEAKDVKWSDSGELVAVVSSTGLYILRYNREVVEEYLESGQDVGEDGVDESFELLHEVTEDINTGLWVGDCFIYTNSAWRLCYVVGGEVTTMFHMDRPQYLLGYIAAQNRIYLVDRDYGIVTYKLLLSVIEFKTLVLREDLEGAEAVLPNIPEDRLNGIAKFLEAQGHNELALQVSRDPDHRFELATQLGNLPAAREIAEAADSEAKWKLLGEMALSAGELDLASTCLAKANDLSGLLLLISSTGSRDKMAELATTAVEQGKHNVAFLCMLLCGKVDECIQLLCDTGRVPEAAFMARTYMPSRVSEMVELWKKDLGKVNKKAAEALADPVEYPNLFPDIQLAVEAEKAMAAEARVLAASAYLEKEGATLEDVLGKMRALQVGGGEEEEEEEVYEDAEEGEAEDEQEEEEAAAEEEEAAVEEEEPAAEPAKMSRAARHEAAAALIAAGETFKGEEPAAAEEEEAEEEAEEEEEEEAAAAEEEEEEAEEEGAEEGADAAAAAAAAGDEGDDDGWGEEEEED